MLSKLFVIALGLTILLFGLAPSHTIHAAPPASGPDIRSVSKSGAGSPQTGEFTPSGDSDVTQAEFPGQEDEADGSAGPYPGIIVNRSLSHSAGNGVSVNSG